MYRRVGTTPSTYRPLIENEHVDRNEPQRLVPKLKVAGQLVTSEARPMTRRSEFGFWLITPLKVAIKSKFKHHLISQIKLHRIIYFTEITSYSLRSWIELVSEVAYISCLGSSVLSQLWLSRLSIAQSDVIAKKRWWPERTSVTSASVCHTK